MTQQDSRVIEVQGLSKYYKKQPAIIDADIAVEKGEIYGLIGPDGAGKSSLMKAIAGVLTFDHGRIKVFDVEVDSDEAAERIKGRISFMPQGLGLNLYAELSIEENIDFFAQLRQVSSDELFQRKKMLLEMTRLEKFRSRPMKNLSGGMKQKLGLICTLIHQPELVILDEPTTGVDPVSRRDFWSILNELLHEHEITALISTAYMDEASRFHRLALMHEGRILASGIPDKICRDTKGCVVELIANPQAQAVTQLIKRFPQLDIVASKIRVFVDEERTDVAVKRVSSNLQNVSIESTQAFAPDLEDAFIALLRHLKISPTQTEVFLDSKTKPKVETSETAIQASDITRDFGTFRAVDHISFSVNEGEIFGLLGANGAGKTTVIKMLTGILSPSSGSGEIAGVAMGTGGRKIKQRIGYMSQAFSLYQDLTVLENLNLYGSIYGVAHGILKKRIAWIIELANLDKFTRTFAGNLPMGIRQRLALGCALVHNPRILFLDEPTSGVDPIGRRQFWNILLHLATTERVTTLITTHYMSEAEHCDKLGLMYSGKLIAQGSPLEMKNQLEQDTGQLISLQVERPLDAIKTLQLNNFTKITLFGNDIHLLVTDLERSIREVTSILSKEGLNTIHCRPIPVTLEDVFVYRVSALESEANT